MIMLLALLFSTVLLGAAMTDTQNNIDGAAVHQEQGLRVSLMHVIQV